MPNFQRGFNCGSADEARVRKVDFSLADGMTITRQVGDAYFECRGEGGAAT